MLERIVIESISKGEDTLESIQKDTSLDYSLVLNITARLIQQGLIKYKEGKYSIYKNEIAWQKVNRGESVAVELKEIAEGMIDNYFFDKEKNILKLQKVYISEKEEKILKSLLDNIESFITNIRADQKKRKVRKETQSQKVIFWAYSEYRDLLDNSIRQAS